MGATTYLFVNSVEQEAKALARGLRTRDPDLLDRLIEQYHYRLFRYLLYLIANRETAEDLFQETWIRVLERGHQYDGESKFETWLFAIARHLAIDWLRRKKFGFEDVDAVEDTKIASNSAQGGAALIDLLSQREESDRIQAAFGRLPAAHREVLILRFQEDLELQEIATVVAAPLSTVKSRLYRGIGALRELLSGEKA